MSCDYEWRDFKMKKEMNSSKIFIYGSVLFFLFCGSILFSIKSIENVQNKLISEITETGNVADGKVRFLGFEIQEFIVQKDTVTNKIDAKVVYKDYYDAVPIIFATVVTVSALVLTLGFSFFLKKSRLNQ